MLYYPEPLADLITELQKMPTIGPKSAERLAFYVLDLSEEETIKLSDALVSASKNITKCSVCFNITLETPCPICKDVYRDNSRICVVATPKELLAIEKTGEYNGLYHVLGGIIAPLNQVSPDMLNIKELLVRVQEKSVKEIIMAINPSVEGEATIIYLSRLLKPLGVDVTRIAYGLPVGGDIDYADELTLTRALEGRRKV